MQPSSVRNDASEDLSCGPPRSNMMPARACHVALISHERCQRGSLKQPSSVRNDASEDLYVALIGQKIRPARTCHVSVIDHHSCRNDASKKPLSRFHLAS